ncbi:MAG TPA: hypothetical protein VFU15_04445 [Bacteroidia bacterium]|nr:hypothetical protein [Bacteroidia bacterium]
MSKDHPGQETKTVIAGQVEIWLSEGIVRVSYLDGADITKEIKMQMHHEFLRITGGKKYPFLFRADGSLWYTREGREYARHIESLQPFLAVAMVAPSLGFRLLAEFYGKFYKPEKPYKVFKTDEEAETWLRSFMN